MIQNILVLVVAYDYLLLFQNVEYCYLRIAIVFEAVKKKPFVCKIYLKKARASKNRMYNI